MQNKRIVIFNQSSGYLTTDIANAFVRSGKYEKVALVIGADRIYERKLDDSVEYRRIIAYNRQSSIKRLLTWLIGYAQIIWLICTKYRGYEALFVSNPPMSCFASRYMKNPFDVLVFDVYPDALTSIGIRPGSLIYRFWSNRNKKIYSKARNVFTISEGMAKAVSNYVDVSKIKVISIWPSSENFKPIDRAYNTWAAEHRLQDKFVVLYSGNMGLTHSVDVLVDVANRLKENNQIVFLFIGQGGKRGIMQEKTRSLSLKNCLFLDFQPTELLPYSLASADIGVVTIDEKAASVSVPSKTFNLMAVGAPLLCIAPKESEINCLVDKYNNGMTFTKEDVEGMASYVELLWKDNAYKKRLSSNSLTAIKDFSFKNAEQFVS